MKRFIPFVAIAIIIIVCLVLTVCLIIDKEENIEVSATVVNIQYIPPRGYYDPALRIPRMDPPKYLVTIEYGDFTQTFDNKTLYQTVEEGDTIQMILYKGYTKNGNLVIQELKMPE